MFVPLRACVCVSREVNEPDSGTRMREVFNKKKGEEQKNES